VLTLLLRLLPLMMLLLERLRHRHVVFCGPTPAVWHFANDDLINVTACSFSRATAARLFDLSEIYATEFANQKHAAIKPTEGIC
jgi:hypothetical protein